MRSAKKPLFNVIFGIRSSQLHFSDMRCFEIFAEAFVLADKMFGSNTWYVTKDGSLIRGSVGGLEGRSVSIDLNDLGWNAFANANAIIRLSEGKNDMGISIDTMSGICWYDLIMVETIGIWPFRRRQFYFKRMRETWAEVKPRLFRSPCF